MAEWYSECALWCLSTHNCSILCIMLSRKTPFAAFPHPMPENGQAEMVKDTYLNNSNGELHGETGFRAGFPTPGKCTLKPIFLLLMLNILFFCFFWFNNYLFFLIVPCFVGLLLFIFGFFPVCWSILLSMILDFNEIM